MFFLTSFHIFFLFFIFLGCFFLTLSKNPVYSVLSLITIFFFSSLTLILFNVDFISILFLIIYVGAIAVLFLFVVMMLNIKLSFLTMNDILLSCFSLIFNIGFFTLFYFFNFFISFDNKFKYIYHFQQVWDSFFSIGIFGQYFYNFFISCFLIAGFILLIAMLGSIVLTLSFISKERNPFNRQLSRTSFSLSFFN